MKTILTLLLSGCCFVHFAQDTLVITNISLVDVNKGELQEEKKNLWISNGRIIEINDYTPSLEFPTDVQQFDGNGKFMLPGLWDMHTHPDDPEMWRMLPDEAGRDLLLPLFVLHGVTGIRDMAGSMEVVKSWRKKIKNKELLGPNIFACGPLIDGPNPMWDGSVGIADLSQVKPVVDSLRTSGSDFLKVYSLLPDSTYYALSNYAKSIDFPFVGHVPFTVTTASASSTGMKSQEHLLNILIDCSEISEHIYNNTLDYNGISDPLEKYVYRNNLMLETYNPEKAKALFKTFVKNKTWHTPTISMWFKNANFEDEVAMDSLLYPYLPRYMRKYWTPQVNDHLQNREARLVSLKQKLVSKYMELIAEMHRAGVPLLAGTDMGANPLCFPGISLHNELDLLVKSGLNPADAIKTATLNPALFLGISEDYGTLEIGKVADLIILDANPLEQISNTRKIFAVIKDGTIYDQQRIAQELLEIKEIQSN